MWENYQAIMLRAGVLEAIKAGILRGSLDAKPEKGIEGFLDAGTAFAVARPQVAARIPTKTQIHGHVVAAILEGMREEASFENCEAEFRYSWCIRQGGVEVLVLWREDYRVRSVEDEGDVEVQGCGVRDERKSAPVVSCNVG